MSKTLDVLEAAAHGTPAGFVDGCKSRGGCPNYLDREVLTCFLAHRAYAHYYLLREQGPEVPITRAMLRQAKRRS
ncbi:hypothetical protein [Microbacterium maritypicum]|uniref:hypothetical protein n=1 Tax=Microbacterium maritypicum TaxID=33918 RepID=UPI0038060FB6